MTDTSPKILALAWGRITTDAGVFRDAKLWPGGGRNWDWNETGTRHEPGVQTADLTDLLHHGAQVVVIGRGQQARLRVTDEAIASARQSGATCEVLRTQEAVARYNALVAQDAEVGALIHTTC